MPDFTFEKQFNGLVAGVDEVGRGPLAGPVISAMAILNQEKLSRFLKENLDDSKKISPGKRKEIYSILLDEISATDGAEMAVGIATVQEIDNINILQATFLSMQRAYEKLEIKPNVILVDGHQKPKFPCQTIPIKKGDQKSLSIAAASILAKETRDQIMDELSREYPAFGWSRNVGYPTKEHREAIQKHGVTPHHRLSFKGVSEYVEVCDPKERSFQGHLSL